MVLGFLIAKMRGVEALNWCVTVDFWVVTIQSNLLVTREFFGQFNFVTKRFDCNDKKCLKKNCRKNSDEKKLCKDATEYENFSKILFLKFPLQKKSVTNISLPCNRTFFLSITNYFSSGCNSSIPDLRVSKSSFI